MLKTEINKSATRVEIAGELQTVTSELCSLIRTMYAHMDKENPAAAAAFRFMLMETVNREDSPLRKSPQTDIACAMVRQKFSRDDLKRAIDSGISAAGLRELLKNCE